MLHELCVGLELYENKNNTVKTSFGHVPHIQIPCTRWSQCGGGYVVIRTLSISISSSLPLLGSGELVVGDKIYSETGLSAAEDLVERLE